MRMMDIKLLRNQMDKKLQLDAMQIESQHTWPTLGNLDERINEHVVVPQTILNFEEYQDKLQKLAMLAEQGDHKRMQSLLDNSRAIERKNELLQPIFRDLKA